MILNFPSSVLTGSKDYRMRNRSSPSWNESESKAADKSVRSTYKGESPTLSQEPRQGWALDA